jgi:hypothetical protein
MSLFQTEEKCSLSDTPTTVLKEEQNTDVGNYVRMEVGVRQKLFVKFC